MDISFLLRALPERRVIQSPALGQGVGRGAGGRAWPRRRALPLEQPRAQAGQPLPGPDGPEQPPWLAGPQDEVALQPPWGGEPDRLRPWPQTLP
ncbi:MAG: hypothetical protein HY681_00290 [Chloroflexi bacterium]|nr:hypothetical protein [Chloroflexota bacterium]